MVTLVALLFAVWSTVFPFGKLMLGYSPPLFLTGSRMLLGGILILGYLLLFRAKSLKLSRQEWLSIGLLALFSIYLTNVLEFWGLQYLSAGKTSFIYSLSPFFAAFFSYLHFNEKINLQKGIGLIIGLLGCLPMLLLQTGSEETHLATHFFSWPTLAVMGAALFSVYGWVLLRLIVKDKAISPLVANGNSMLLGGILALAHSFFVESWNPIPVAAGNQTPFFTGVVAMTLLYNVLCYNAYGWMLRRFTATFLSFIGLLSPIFASLVGWILLGETPSLQIFLSSAIVCFGLWIVYRAELKQGYIQTGL